MPSPNNHRTYLLSRQPAQASFQVTASFQVSASLQETVSLQVLASFQVTTWLQMMAYPQVTVLSKARRSRQYRHTVAFQTGSSTTTRLTHQARVDHASYRANPGELAHVR